MEENHVNLVRSDSEGDDFLTEEEQGFCSSKQTENNHEDSKYYQLGFENAIMRFTDNMTLGEKRTKGPPTTIPHKLRLGIPQKIFLKRQKTVPTP